MNTKHAVAVILAAGLFSISAAACSGPRMTTEETCEELGNFIASNMFGEQDEQLMYDELEQIQKKASKDLKDPLKVLLDYVEAESQENPDPGHLEELDAAYSEADDELERICG